MNTFVKGTQDFLYQILKLILREIIRIFVKRATEYLKVYLPHHEHNIQATAYTENKAQTLNAAIMYIQYSENYVCRFMMYPLLNLRHNRLNAMKFYRSRCSVTLCA